MMFLHARLRHYITEVAYIEDTNAATVKLTFAAASYSFFDSHSLAYFSAPRASIAESLQSEII